MKKLFALCLLAALALVFPVLGSAQIQVVQIPTTCTAYVIYFYTPQGGAYTSLSPGTYVCLPGNVFASYGGTGGATQALLSNYTNATATASAVVTAPLLANINYKFSCNLFWQNSGANATVFTLVTPASPTSVIAYATTNTATAVLSSGALSGTPLAYTATAGAGATTYRMALDGYIQNVTAGNLVFEGSATTGTVTILAGSSCSVNSNP